MKWWHVTDELSIGHLAGQMTSAGLAWETPDREVVWLWLNLQGVGLLWGQKERYPLHPGMYAVTGGMPGKTWQCMRQSGAYQVDVVAMPKRWLAQRLGKNPHALHPEFRNWLEGKQEVTFCGLMGEWEKQLAGFLLEARSGDGVALLMAEARLLEWAALRLFRPRTQTGDTFCAQFKKIGPIGKALMQLQSRLDQPLDLAHLARSVGMAPHQLSRKVKQETGITLQLHLRRYRISRACEELTVAGKSITEVALDVGYQSLPHFAQAFRAEMGCNPSEWLKQRH